MNKQNTSEQKCSLKTLGMGIYSYAKRCSAACIAKTLMSFIRRVHYNAPLWTTSIAFAAGLEVIYLIGLATIKVFDFNMDAETSSLLFGSNVDHSLMILGVGSNVAAALAIVGIALYLVRSLILHLCERGQEEIKDRTTNA